MSGDPRVRSPRAVVALAAALAVAVAVGATRAWWKAPAGASPAAAPFPGGGKGGDPKFGRGTEARIAALRDRLVAGLASLAEPDGGWPGGPRLEKDPWARRESTALAFAALSAARSMGSRAPALDAAAAGAHRLLTAPPRATPGSIPSRGGRLVGLSATVWGFVLAADPADADRLDRGAGEIAREADLGPLPEAWPRAIATRAAVAVIEAGRAAALGADPWRVVQVKGRSGKADAEDANVVEAFALAARSGEEAPAWAKEVLAACIDMHSEWSGDRTDVQSWAMRAFLAGRSAAGDAWFAAILPQLEKAPNAAGVVEGDFYGDPVSRTAEALLIVAEGAAAGGTAAGRPPG